LDISTTGLGSARFSFRAGQDVTNWRVEPFLGGAAVAGGNVEEEA